MTASEAIKTIDIAIAEVEWDYSMDYAVAFEVAKVALEKQIQKKPVYKEHRMICPNCKSNIHYMVEKQDYCPDCGQALDWSET